MDKECINCNKERKHHAKGLCYNCYKKLKWKPKTISCKRCKRKRALHAKGLCAGCYNYLFHLDKNKAYNHRKTNKVNLSTYRKLTKSCVICGFNKIVDLHYIDSNKENDSQKNLIGLCPNHKRMANNFNFKNEIFNELKNKGFNVPSSTLIDFHNSPNL